MTQNALTLAISLRDAAIAAGRKFKIRVNGTELGDFMAYNGLDPATGQLLPAPPAAVFPSGTVFADATGTVCDEGASAAFVVTKDTGETSAHTIYTLIGKARAKLAPPALTQGKLDDILATMSVVFKDYDNGPVADDAEAETADPAE